MTKHWQDYLSDTFDKIELGIRLCPHVENILKDALASLDAAYDLIEKAELDIEEERRVWRSKK